MLKKSKLLEKKEGINFLVLIIHAFVCGMSK